jgi:hypothetical protein
MQLASSSLAWHCFIGLPQRSPKVQPWGFSAYGLQAPFFGMLGKAPYQAHSRWAPLGSPR